MPARPLTPLHPPAHNTQQAAHSPRHDARTHQGTTPLCTTVRSRCSSTAPTRTPSAWPAPAVSSSSQQQQQGAGRPDGLILTDLVPDVLALVYDCLPSKEDRRNFHHSCAAPSTRCRSCVPRRVRTKRPVCASLFHTSARLVPHVAFTCFPQHRRLSVCDAGAQDLAALGWKPQGADQFP